MATTNPFTMSSLIISLTSRKDTVSPSIRSLGQERHQLIHQWKRLRHTFCYLAPAGGLFYLSLVSFFLLPSAHFARTAATEEKLGMVMFLLPPDIAWLFLECECCVSFTIKKTRYKRILKSGMVSRLQQRSSILAITTTEWAVPERLCECYLHMMPCPCWLPFDSWPPYGLFFLLSLVLSELQVQTRNF
jgi:hypothetical protein